MSHAQDSSSPDHLRLPCRTEAATIGQPSYSETLPRTPEAVGQARGLVVLALAVWGLGPLADDATLVVSELTTNAVLHARGEEIRVTVDRLSTTRVRVAVADQSTKVPSRSAPCPYDESGRGLILVNALAHATGTTATPLGKRTWAELDREARR
ncbi:ATP-binding protein [Streptomyces sp. NRRL F-5630]|uniref:ATP-binding protein n=1 Tax=Streptomyces sp. NRRL F-5630 TaxID=1463864 RepID=UPI003EBC408B